MPPIRGLTFATAVQADLSHHARHPDERAQADALLQWFLPLVKTLGGEVGFETASDAMQVLGGAGYTTKWPIEQGLRDARVLTIFEGTTGIQALDLLHRRLCRDAGRGLDRFLALARADLLDAPEAIASALAPTLDRLEMVGQTMMNMRDDRRDAEAGAYGLLQLAGLEACGWIAARLASLPDPDPASRRLAALGEYWLTRLDARSAVAMHDPLLGNAQFRAFELFRPR